MTTITVNLADHVRTSDTVRDVDYGADGKPYSRARQHDQSPLYRAVNQRVRADVGVSCDWALRRITIYPLRRFEPHHAVFAVTTDHPVWESLRKWRAGEPWTYTGAVSFEICESYLTRPIDGAEPVIRRDALGA